MSSLVAAAIVLGILAGIVTTTVNTASSWITANQEPIDSSLFTLRMAHFAYDMDRLYDSLPDVPLEIADERHTTSQLFFYWGQFTNSTDLARVSMLVLPHFNYEFGFEPVVPQTMGFVPFKDGMEAFHILGRASCSEDLMIFNWSYINNYDPRYQRDSLLPTIVHELGHVQSICCSPGHECNSGMMETANQVATLEILAAMANRGNIFAIKPLVGQLRDYALDYVRGATHGNGTEGYYLWFADNVIRNDPDERARIAKSRRWWAETEEKQWLLREITVNYGMRPMYVIQMALDGDLIVESPFYPNSTMSIRIDDLDYFLKHLDQAAKIAYSSKQ